MSHSCPAFARNGVCKHIAAALTYLVESGFAGRPTGLFTAPDASSHPRPGSSLEQA
ncbi:SWIM zinc finger family protein [Kyrpidia tusciae]|uniref:SWIM zinc finger family protein n=1 Tax=Kyrpidia tusciae TaxID=33943 RepID=UPI003898D9B5